MYKIRGVLIVCRQHLGQYSICMYKYVACRDPESPLFLKLDVAISSSGMLPSPDESQAPSLPISPKSPSSFPRTRPMPVSIHACKTTYHPGHMVYIKYRIYSYSELHNKWLKAKAMTTQESSLHVPMHISKRGLKRHCLYLKVNA
jgi:hypothetical protein